MRHMPFVNGRYTPDKGDNSQKEPGDKRGLFRRKREKQEQPQLTPEELELIEQERARQAEESAAYFEELIHNDDPDLTKLNELIQTQKKKESSPWHRCSPGIKVLLTALLLGCILLMFISMAFASATMLVGSLAAMAVLSLVYFIAVPR